MSELKTKRNDGNVTDFINKIQDPNKKADSLEIIKLMQEITGEEPKMWGDSIIGFGTYTYKYSSGRSGEWMRLGFSPRKQNLTLYIMPGFDIGESLLPKLGKYKTGKSCLYIKKLEDVDVPTLKELIQNAANFMDQKYPKA